HATRECASATRCWTRSAVGSGNEHRRARDKLRCDVPHGRDGCRDRDRSGDYSKTLPAKYEGRSRKTQRSMGETPVGDLCERAQQPAGWSTASGCASASSCSRGSGPALNSLAGNIVLMLDNITASINLARAGQIKGLAVTSAKPSALAPDFPTVAERVHGLTWRASMISGARRYSTGSGGDYRKERRRNFERTVRERLLGRHRRPHCGVVISGDTEFLARERVPWSKILQEIGIRIE